MDNITELINRRRHQLLVHSCLYYKLSNPLIDDTVFDKWAYELVHLQENYPEISKKVQLHDIFKDWDGSTGFHLPYDNAITVNKAHCVLNYNRRLHDDKNSKVRGRSNAKGNKTLFESTGNKGSKKTTRKKATKQWGNSLF